MSAIRNIRITNQKDAKEMKQRRKGRLRSILNIKFDFQQCTRGCTQIHQKFRVFQRSRVPFIHPIPSRKNPISQYVHGSTMGLLILQDLIFFKVPIYSFLLALSPRWAFTQSTLSSNNPKQSYQLCMYDLYSLCVFKDHEIRFSQYICNLSLVAQAMHGCKGCWWILSVFGNLNKYLQNNP